ncbi:hypothetical protein CPB83DRAFT_857152 [Crepidotus variabilis]|uniref:Uncharacterized protein n=1 Tax=Crepidotus variabilis TaxID=179855 RepID=A0A9P6ECF6_9AGAR|nr:hypothetical protein CPB83DRAFT_857152 [Crepidotus variabilis]
MAVADDTPNGPSPPGLPDIPESAITDPPPPYPTPHRQRQSRSNRPHARVQPTQLVTQHSQQLSNESQSDYETPLSPYTVSSGLTDEDDGVPVGAGPGGGAEESAVETSPFLSPNSNRRAGRARSFSMSSTASAAESMAHTVLSLFQPEDDMCYGDGHIQLDPDDHMPILSSGRPGGLFSAITWKRYFRPMRMRAFYRPLMHLTVINFPYALAAWIYLFVFTVSGTTLLVALPIGAVLCFFNLLGARAFSRGELYLQTRFHAPLAHPPPHPPLPIFARYREPTNEELENGTVAGQLRRGGQIREKSFYKNTYAMFTDSRSYQALFYFLVIKPAITLLISIGLVVFGIPLFVLVLPAPAVLRATRKIGIWQANVAVEGLYYAVR